MQATADRANIHSRVYSDDVVRRAS